MTAPIDRSEGYWLDIARDLRDFGPTVLGYSPSDFMLKESQHCGVSYVDDAVFTLVASANSIARVVVPHAKSLAFGFFNSHGMEVNCKLGKSEAAIRCFGDGAKEERRRLEVDVGNQLQISIHNGGQVV